MFLYTSMVQKAVADMAHHVPDLSHIDPQRVLVVSGPRACTSTHGNLAQCYALKEREVNNFTYWYHRRTRNVVRVTPWARFENTRVSLFGNDILYLILLRLPRLLLHDPLETVIHELVHIGPDFDGRLHRLRHGKRFNALVKACADTWRKKGNPELVEALQMDYNTLARRGGSLLGRSFGPPFVSPRVCRLENPPPVEAHPDFRRKHLTCNPLSLEVIEGKWTPSDVPAHLTEKDLVYRLYTPSSARRVPASVVQLASQTTSAQSWAHSIAP